MIFIHLQGHLQSTIPASITYGLPFQIVIFVSSLTRASEGFAKLPVKNTFFKTSLWSVAKLTMVRLLLTMLMLLFTALSVSLYWLFTLFWFQCMCSVQQGCSLECFSKKYYFKRQFYWVKNKQPLWIKCFLSDFTVWFAVGLATNGIRNWSFWTETRFMPFARLQLQATITYF